MKNKQLNSLIKNFLQQNETFKLSKSSDFFENMKHSQSPEVTLVTCCDSRVHVDILTDTPQNNIFMIRNIGNQIASNEGAVEYGVNILQTPFLIILGHSNCGAVQAAINTPEGLSKNILGEIEFIPKNTKNFNDAILNNISHQVNAACNKFETTIDKGELDVVGMLYDFSNDFGQGPGSLFLTHINEQAIEMSAIENNYADLL